MKERFSDKTTVAVPGDSPRAQRLAETLDRYMQELESGGIPPDVDELVAQHPDLADELRGYVDSLKVLHQMTAGLRPMPTRAEPSAEPATKRLGDYDILREIGRGGMGIVYEARQLSLNRHVALKVLPFAAMMDEKQIARFRNEAQAAAQLHHPNIVPVHAVGQERGVHYFAMQYVPGQSLEAALRELQGEPGSGEPGRGGTAGSERASKSTAIAGSQASYEEALADTFAAFTTKESTRSRRYCESVARLMIQAADAIQHAHDCGVIHRDVKPSNLLLDRQGKLWVTDFGLARMQSDAGVTITGDVVGTLRYMSPEQAAGATGLVDARADVYSLGATLYEMLTLRPAHTGDNRQQMLRNIENREPPAPRSINPSIPPDLETITLRAMAKSRDDRYLSAKQLADDLRRFLEGRPTIARRPTVFDRASKWALRHRAAVLVAAGVMLVITAVSSGAALMIAQKKAELEVALRKEEVSRERAQESFQNARGVVGQFVSSFANELKAFPGAEPLRQEMLRKSRAYYLGLLEQSEGNTALTRDLAVDCVQAAAIAEALGDRGEAIEFCRLALVKFDELAKRSPDDLELALERARCRSGLGLLLAGGGDVPAALEAYRTAIDEHQALVKRQGAGESVTRSLADVHSKFGLLLAQVGRKDESSPVLRSSIGLLSRLAERHPEDRKVRHDLALSHNTLSFVEREIDWARAENSSRRAIALLDRLADEDDGNDAVQTDLALCENNLGAILAHRQAWDEAAASYRHAIKIQERLVRRAPAVVSYRRDLAVSWNNLGQTLDAESAPTSASEAAEAFAEAERIVAVLVDDFPTELAFRSLYGAVKNNQAMVLEAAGDRESALEAFEQAIKQQRVAFDRAPLVSEYREHLSKHYFNYGRALRAAGQPDKAAEAALARRELWRGDGRRLGQVTVELAEAAVAVRELTAGDGAGTDELADRLENEVEVTLREAAAAGCDLATLRGQSVFQLLRKTTIWSTINAAPGAAANEPEQPADG
jgi:serine/threonine protein kinase/tetratricopeptide (TPR) repeat protein